MPHPFLDRLARGPILGDGAMGTMLHARGAALDQCLEELNLTQPDWVRDIHLGYIKAGAEIIQTNTFGASRPRLADFGLADKVREINFRGVKLAREAREISGQAVWIAGSVGPLGKRAHARRRPARRPGRGRLPRADRRALGSRRRPADLRDLLRPGRAGARRARWRARRTDLPVVAEMTFGNDGIDRVRRDAGRGGAHAGRAGRGRGGRQLLAGAGAHAGVHRRDARGRAGRCACRPCPTRASPIRAGRADDLSLGAALLRRARAAVPGRGRLCWSAAAAARRRRTSRRCGRRWTQRPDASQVAGHVEASICSHADGARLVARPARSDGGRSAGADRPPEEAAGGQVRGQRRGRSAARLQRGEDAGGRARRQGSAARTRSTWPTARWRASAWARWRCAC